MEEKITIFTPTYNRSEKLHKLYNSLKEQTNKNFIWLVIDDGSTDNTLYTIESFKKENVIQVEYYKKENGGKHTAINFGVKHINTNLTYMVDSDDSLLPNAVETLYRYYNKYKDNDNICGFNFLRQFPDGRINGRKFPKEEMLGSYIEVRINENIDGDKTTMFYTKCLKEYPFPEFKGEKFLGEDTIWIEMANKYTMLSVNKPIYVGEYLNEGLTKTRRTNNIKSPKGASFRGRVLMNKKCNVKTRLKGALSYLVYGKFANYKLQKLLYESPYKTITVLSLIPSIIIYESWKRKYKE